MARKDNERRRRISINSSIILTLFFVIQATTTITQTDGRSLIEKRQPKNDFEPQNYNYSKHTQPANNTRLKNSTTATTAPTTTSKTDNDGAAKQQHQFGTQLLSPNPANQNNTKQTNRTDKLESLDKILASGSKAKAKAIRVDSKTGKTLARMQPLKRQVDGNGELNSPSGIHSLSSRRNEDPWFLDQTPYPLQPYRFVYNIKGKNGLTEQYRQEVGDGKYLTGSYGYVLPDGIYRHVDYVADDRGFRAFIRTSEPGTANQNPSNVVINSNPVVTAPGVTYVSNTNNESIFPLPNYNVPPPSTSLTDYSSSQSSAGQTLARRPPGSIVNTPLRNFTSFSYTTPAPFLSSATPSLFNLRAPSFNDGYKILNNTFTSSSLASPTSSSSLSELNKPSTTSQSGTSWGSTGGGNQFVDDDVFTRIKPLSLPATNTQPTITNTNLLNYNKLDYLGAIGQDKPQSTIGNLFGQRQAIELQSKSGPGKLAYDRLLSNQDTSGATNKLNYDMNYVFHPESPLLSLERARNLAQLDQLNAAGPGLQYIRPLLSTDAGNLSPLGQINPVSQFGGGGGGSGGGINLSSGRSGVEHSSKSEEHHQRRTESQSRQNSDTNNKLLVTSKEHQIGTKSGSGREFEYHQTTNHNLLPLNGPGQLIPPPPYLNSKASTDNSAGQLQAPPTIVAVGAVKGGGGGGQNRQLQAPYTGFGQQSRSDQGVKTIQEQFGSQVSLPPPTSPLPPSPPAPPNPPEEPSSGRTGSNQEFQLQQQQNNGPVTLSSGSGEQQQQQQAEQQAAATKSTLGPFESQQERQQTTSAQSPTTSSSSSHDYDQDSSDQQARKGGTKSGSDANQRSQRSESWLGATRSPSSFPSPIRTVRMQPDDFRTTMMMNDLRSMQNTFGLPQPPRLHRERSPHEIDQFQAQVPNLNPTPHLDHILASRMNRVDALLSSARSNGNNKFNDPQNEPQNRLQSQNLVSGSSSNQAASIHKSNALSTSGSKANEIVDEHLARLHSNNNNKPSKQRKPVANATSTILNTNNSLDESISSVGKQRFQTGPIIKLSNSLDGGNNFNEAGLLPVNETLFDARRLSAANKAKLQAEKVSELEKFQQRLRTQQLLLEQIKNPTIEKPGLTFATAANKTLHQLVTARRNNNNNSNQPLTTTAEQVNSHVKYDEEVDGSNTASRSGSNQNGSSQSHSLSSSSSLENLKPLLIKIEPTGRDYTRLRRQNAGNESTLSPISSLLNEHQKAGNSEDKFFNISLNSTSPIKRLDSEHSSSGGEKNSGGSEFAQQIKRWPSILQQQNNIDTNTTTSSNTNNDFLSKGNPLDRLIDSKPTDVALNRDEDSKSNAHNHNKSALTPTSTSTSAPKHQQAATNTINLDFINSVTALSVDHLNPFAISSVNPAVQRSFAASQQQQMKQVGGGGNSFSNQNHNSVNGSSGDGFVESRLSPHKLGETGPNIGVATTSARYFNSPEILAALDYHERRDTSGHLKSLLPDESVAASHKPTTMESHGLRPTNHRFAALAPYTMKQQIDLNQLGTRKVQFTTGTGSLQEQTMSSSEAKKLSSYDSTTIPKLHEISNHKLSQYSPIKETQSSSSSSSSPLLNKDGFEIEENSAHVQVDNQRFYEVVSSFSPPNDYSSSIASSQAFRDPQLSISALTNR